MQRLFKYKQQEQKWKRGYYWQTEIESLGQQVNLNWSTRLHWFIFHMQIQISTTDVVHDCISCCMFDLLSILHFALF